VVVVVNSRDDGPAPPTITSNGGGATAAISFQENSIAAVTTVAATGSSKTFSITGGADAAKFEINADTGELKFVAAKFIAGAPDFERPTFAGNKAYEVIVTVSSGGLTDTQTLAVKVTNVAEVPAATSLVQKLDVTDVDFLRLQAGAVVSGDGSLGFTGVGALNTQNPLEVTDSFYLAQTTGIRTSSGFLNNLTVGKENFGTADQPFLRLLPQVSRGAEAVPAGLENFFPPGQALAAGTPTAYNNGNVLGGTGGTTVVESGRFVVDSTPREISNLVANETQFHANTPIPDAFNPLPFSAVMTLFGQFFDHGLDLIPKGGQGTVFIPLLPSDPLYNDPRGANPPTIEGDRTFNNFMTLSRGSFTLDDAGNRVYTNTVSPLIDQNQTYGSTAGMTVFLREYHDTDSAITANGVSITNAYIAAIDAAILDVANAAIKDALIAIKPAILTAIAGEITSAVNTNTTAISTPIDAAVAAAITANGGQNITAIADAIDGNLNSPRYFVNAGDPTGRLVTGEDGGMATWADIKANALKIGIVLTDADVLNLPKVDVYPDGVAGKSVIPVSVVGASSVDTYLGGTYVRHNAGAGGARLVAVDATFNLDGSEATAVVLIQPGDTTTSPLRIGHALLNDIANGASPGRTREGKLLVADDDGVVGLGALPASFSATTHAAYDNELLDAHFIAGDGRANENIGLTSIHAVFHSEHNRVVAELRALDAAQGIERTGEQIFQAARLVVEMQYQHIVFAEFARLISPNIALFADYSTQIDPVITLEFSQAVYRFGHSMLTETVDLMDASGNLTEVGLIQAFLNPLAFANLDGTANGLASIVDTGSRAVASQVIKGMSQQVGSEIDEMVTPALRNNLVGLPLDLAAINIARGRDVGIPSLNAARAKFFEMTGGAASLKPYVSWTDFGNNLLHPESLKNFIMAYAGKDLQAHQVGTSYTVDQWAALRISALPAEQAAYANALSAAADNAMTKASFMAVGGNQKFNEIDLWLGGLAEKKVFMGMLGSTFDFVFSTQMEALQEGDRLYYLNRLVGTNLLTEIEGQSFADIIMRNTDAKHLYARVFLVADAYVEIGTPGSWRAGEHLYGADGLLLDPENLARIGAGWSMATVATVGEDNKATLGVNEAGIDDPATLNVDEGANPILRFKFTGTDLGEMIGGTEADDDIFGGARNDTIYGDGGDDIIDGGTGDNFLYGGLGNDIIKGGDGVDFIQGNEGNDDIHAGEGIDEAFGGLGNDIVHGGGGSDAVSGGGGDDILYGDDDADALTGGLGNDTLYGGLGGDFLDGQEDNDILIGGAGEDIMFGMDGDDTFIQSSGDVGLGHLLDGGRGFDVADYRAAGSAVQLNLSNNKAAIIQPGPIVTRFDVFDGIEKVFGSHFNDVIIGNNPIFDGLNSLDPTFTYNTIVGGQGGDRMSGSLGRDRYEFAQGDSTVVVFGGNNNGALDTGDSFDFYQGVAAVTTSLADNVIGIINAGTVNEVDFADFGVGGDTIYLATNLSATGASLTLMTVAPGNGQVTDQQYFMVRGTFNADGGGQFNVNTTAGFDTLVVYDGNSATGVNAVLQTALVLSGTGGAAFTHLDANPATGILGSTFTLGVVI